MIFASLRVCLTHQATQAVADVAYAYGYSSPAGPDVYTPTPADGGEVVLTRTARQRYKVPIYNLTTGQPLPDVKGGNLVVNFDNSAFHSLFPPGNRPANSSTCKY